MAGHTQLPTRRDQYAEMTRREIVAVARRLFAEQGYARTTVGQIARGARVSPATVYAQCGGKEGLLGILIDMWTAAQIVRDIIAACEAADTGRTKLEVLAEGYVAIYEESGDIIRIVERAAASVPVAEAFLRTADERHQEALRQIVQRIQDVGDLADGVSVEDAVRIIFFHFRYDQFALASDAFGWGVDRAVRWITERLGAAILRD
ncbi:TetR/AcrR family transcriptional regulator [Promicromonospora sp. NPDC059942]|uniref:TetR/AcrR family transcriptional regulator n=1 Tax=Promicromonospora sp. NPDC059942 TaxID=3347009 RepID=UPI0036559E67